VARLANFISECFLVIFFCSAYVIHLFGQCSRFLDPALDTRPLKMSSHLQ